LLDVASGAVPEAALAAGGFDAKLVTRIVLTGPCGEVQAGAQSAVGCVGGCGYACALLGMGALDAGR
jgi:hypothetical protein